MANAKKGSRPTKSEPEEGAVGWTIRMPTELARRIKELARTLTAKGEGKWTGNMIAVRALERGLEALEGDAAKKA